MYQLKKNYSVANITIFSSFKILDVLDMISHTKKWFIRVTNIKFAHIKYAC